MVCLVDMILCKCQSKGFFRRNQTSSEDEQFNLRFTQSAIFLASVILLSNETISSEKSLNEPNPRSISTIFHLETNAVADAAEVALPSVVNISCSVPNLLGSLSSTGSGFIISKDGFIATNAHVIAGSKDGKVVVTMSDLSKRSGYVHSLDDKTDIALIKLTDIADDLPVARFGQSNRLRVGDFVLALGSPLYLQNTVTFGIVSSLSRHGTELGIAKSRNEYIQTDAAINVGNSGGPLVNIHGEVIGINVMKAQGVDGISFAIPIDTARLVISQLKEHKKVVRPHVGLKMASVVMRNANSAHVQVLVQEVEVNSPAFRAGISR
jgi:HtrA serine peptidase 2